MTDKDKGQLTSEAIKYWKQGQDIDETDLKKKIGTQRYSQYTAEKSQNKKEREKNIKKGVKEPSTNIKKNVNLSFD